jgi:hypothetical protein
MIFLQTKFDQNLAKFRFSLVLKDFKGKHFRKKSPEFSAIPLIDFKLRTAA